MEIRIGITSGSEPNNIEGYIRSVERLSAIPDILCPGECTPQRAACALQNLSGLLLAGGKDVHPSNYESRIRVERGLPLPRLMQKYHINPDPARDVMELSLIEAAVKNRMPILGICRGLQVLNVALGGGIIMDVRTGVRHAKHPGGRSAAHGIRLQEGSRLAEVLRVEEMRVNSRHHQGITDAELSPELRAAAYSPDDGIIEAVEAADTSLWITAVQWHPERENDDFVHRPCRELFAAFVNACAEH